MRDLTRVEPHQPALAAGIDDHIPRTVVRVHFHRALARWAVDHDVQLLRINGNRLRRPAKIGPALTNEQGKYFPFDQDPAAVLTTFHLHTVHRRLRQLPVTARAIRATWTIERNDPIRRIRCDMYRLT